MDVTRMLNPFLANTSILYPFNFLSVNPAKWSNTLKQFVGKLPTNYLIVLDHFVGLVIKKSIGFKMGTLVRNGLI